MATVNIKLSQDVVDQQQILAFSGSGFDLSPGGLLAALGSFSDGGGTPSWSYDGYSLIATYPDGTKESYNNMRLDHGSAGSGHASATGYQFIQDNVRLSAAGNLNMDYGHMTTAAGDTLWFSPSGLGSMITYLRVDPLVPGSGPTYDPVFGNKTLIISGAMTMSPTGQMGGTMNSIVLDADKFLSNIHVDGHFTLSDNAVDGLGGVLTGYEETYQDRSTIFITGLNADMGTMNALGEDMLSDSGYFGGADDISVDLPAYLYGSVTINAGDGDDKISLKGGGGKLGVQAGAGNDQISLLGGAHTVDGGSGIDTIHLTSYRSSAIVQHVPPQGTQQGSSDYTLTEGSGTVSQLTDVERIAFYDVTVALDIDGNGGQAYRLYQAAFARTPDKAGLGYWINALDKGASLFGVAQAFVDSDEFRAAYGVNPSNHDVVAQFYQNILHRAPDQAGLDYWVGVLDQKQGTVAQVLMAMSESAENKAGLIGVIGNGFDYTPYH